MKTNIEIFRGLGAMAAFEAGLIRALLAEEGIPTTGGSARVSVAAADYDRAREIIAARFADIRDAAAEVPEPSKEGHGGAGAVAGA